jgi:beta-ureidopropionase / N-carbamoyl-L-amino-acid hydrolase
VHAATRPSLRPHLPFEGKRSAKLGRDARAEKADLYLRGTLDNDAALQLANKARHRPPRLTERNLTNTTRDYHPMPDTPPSADGARVLADLNALRAIGAYKSGVHKPTFSEPHLRSLQWLLARLPDAGLTGAIDGIGNVLTRAAKAGPKLLAGSHLESQNYAGWLDGPLGVVYALEAARVLNNDPGIPGAVEVAAWCDEEGHFGHFLGSRSYVGGVTEADIDAAVDRTSGRTMREALSAAGLAGVERQTAERGRHVGYLEAHIEQGKTLESEGLKIGVVTSIVGIFQYRITFTGEQNHAGTTRMTDRKDAGLALAKFCVAIDERFPKICGPRTVWTTGRITLDPGAPSIIPGRAEMLFQIRDADVAVVARLEAALNAMAEEVNAQGRCAVTVECLRRGRPAMMESKFQEAIEAASSNFAGGKSLRMPSGAGHDAQVLATIMPAGMLFVPSIGGVSHHWTENTADEDIVTGAQVFVDACGRLLTQ